jgi:hypothetical protein
MKGLLFALLLLAGSVEAQPYLDVSQVMYQNSPGGDPKKFQHLRAQLNLPYVFKDSSIFVFNPIWEERWLQISEVDRPYHLRGFITWFTYSKRIGQKWETMLAFIPRWNGETSIQFKEGFQAGAAILGTYKQRPGLSYKFGLYYNKEFYGNLFVPLLGLDWKINSRQRLFGILPGYFTYENRVTRKISWGGNFRTFTNSYKILSDNNSGDPTSFIRIDDNQLGAYLGYYVTPKLVGNVELGYSIMRKVRSGVNSKDDMVYLSRHDGFYIRAVFQYRLRFDKSSF